jgi:hypothetical protein
VVEQVGNVLVVVAQADFVLVHQFQFVEQQVIQLQ